jgi:hypothetical protein
LRKWKPMSKSLSADNLVRVLAGLLLALLTYEAKGLCDKVDSLERNQTRIMVSLGIEPVAGETPRNPWLASILGPRPENHGNQISVPVP